MHKTLDDWWVPDMDTRKVLPRPRGLPGFLGLCKKKRVALDIGAHVGTWTVPLARVFQYVAAFEPAGDSRACLDVNIAEACLRNVEIRDKACGSRPFKCVMVQDERPGRAKSSGNRWAMPAIGGDHRIETIDTLALSLDIDFIKIDVEGADIEVLNGACATIEKWHPVLVVEVSDKIPPERFHRENGDVDKFMASVGYSEVKRYKSDRAYIWKP